MMQEKHFPATGVPGLPRLHSGTLCMVKCLGEAELWGSEGAGTSEVHDSCMALLELLESLFKTSISTIVTYPSKFPAGHPAHLLTPFTK